jgi:hypothetical protein
VLIGKESSTSYGYTMIDSSRLKGSADSEQGGAEGAASALDQNTDTIWHTNYTGGIAADLESGTNCTYTILLDENTDIGKLEYVPRQDGGSNGIILSYRLFYSTTATGENFQEISIKDNTWSYDDDTKSVTFVAENARRIRIMAVTTAPDNQFISAAEFRLYAQYKIATPATYLSDLYLSATKEIKKDQDKSFTLPADTTVTVDLEGKDLDYFQAQAAGADASGAVLKIYGDGNLLYTSDALKMGSDAENIFLQVTGIKELKFQTTGSVSLADARFKQKEDHTSLSLYEGESVSVLANGTLTPENRGVITWTSENTAVATVSKEGVVTAVGEGTTRILASYGTETLVCTVTVKKVPETKASAVEKNTSSGQQNTVSQTEKNTEKKETTTTTVTKPKKVTIKKVKAGKKKATVTWQKVTGASGYEVWMKTGSGAFKKVKSLSAKKSSLTVKKLKAGKKYTFKVRAYKKGADGKKVYGAYSKKKTIKI